MGRRTRGVCGGDHRIAIASLSGEVSGYWKTTALLAAAVAAGAGLVLPGMSLHGRLSLLPLRGGDLGLLRVVDDGERWSTVVGVVDEPPAVGLGGAIQPRYTVYLSVLQHPPTAGDLLVRPQDYPQPTVLSAAGAGLGPGALDQVATPVRALVGGQAAPLRWFAAQLGLQGWAMLAMATLGSLAVTRLWVSSLLGELGLRRALGSRRRQTVTYVLLRAGAVAAAGIAGGVWFGGAVWSMLPGLVPGLDPWDAGVAVRFGAVLLASALLGALPPALRAARATPASLLSAP